MSTVFRPSSPLKIVTDTSGQSTPDSNADELVVENSGNAGISILTPDTGVGRISFGDATSATTGGMSYDHSTNTLAFFTDGNQQRFAFDGNGRFLIDTTTSSLATKVEIDDSIGLLDSAGGDVNFIGEVDNGAFASVFLRESTASGNGLRYDASNSWAEIYGVDTNVNSGNPFPIIRFDRDGERITFFNGNVESGRFESNNLLVGNATNTSPQGDLHVAGGGEFIFEDVGAPTDEKIYRFNIDATGDLDITTRDDTYGFGSNVWKIIRTGTNIERHEFYAQGDEAVYITNPSTSSVNYLSLSGATTGNGPEISVAGSDSDIDLVLVPKGQGVTQVTGDFTTTGRIQDTEFGNYYESTVDLGTGLSGTVTLDLSQGNIFHGSFSGATTFAMSTIPSSGLTATLTLYITDTSGLPSYTWPSGTLWPGGTEPSWTANGTDVVTLSTRDGGTTWYGFPVAFGMA